jgi:2-keto-4-pentenoate hydratase/2-oxohepta-3-ene-1,7-dioic acid hydratase in catechol pathway
MQDRTPATEALPNGFLSVQQGQSDALAVKTGHGIFDVRGVAEATKRDLPTTMEALIAGGEWEMVRGVVASHAASGGDTARLDEREIIFAPPVTRPEKIIVVGANYRDHLDEIGWNVPEFPLFFGKFNNRLLGHRGQLVLPHAGAEQFDYEVELVMVIGKTARDVAERDALRYVFGYCVGNDFSARDLQTRTSQVMLGKTCDGFAPIGPVLVPARDVPNPNDLGLECFVNGQRRQSGRTTHMIFPCAFLVSYLSRYMTLRPGDIIFTGTPAGPILGYPEAERKWLKAGDVVESRIERLGMLQFTLA